LAAAVVVAEATNNRAVARRRSNMIALTERMAFLLTRANGGLIDKLLALLKTRLVPFLAWLATNPTGENDLEALVLAFESQDWKEIIAAEQKLFADWQQSHQ
jgi:hypothetical protein